MHEWWHSEVSKILNRHSSVNHWFIILGTFDHRRISTKERYKPFIFRFTETSISKNKTTSTVATRYSKQDRKLRPNPNKWKWRLFKGKWNFCRFIFLVHLNFNLIEHNPLRFFNNFLRKVKFWYFQIQADIVYQVVHKILP